MLKGISVYFYGWFLAAWTHSLVRGKVKFSNGKQFIVFTFVMHLCAFLHIVWFLFSKMFTVLFSKRVSATQCFWTCQYVSVFNFSNTTQLRECHQIKRGQLKCHAFYVPRNYLFFYLNVCFTFIFQDAESVDNFFRNPTWSIESKFDPNVSEHFYFFAFSDI